MANCPYCHAYFPKKGPAIDHMNKKHPAELEQDNMDAPQRLYYETHGTLKGKCICGCDTPTEWNYKTGKPYKVSPDPECRKRLKTIADANKYKVYGTTNLLTDMDRQREMQRHRRIAGVYQFRTGGKVEYLAKMELNWLQFCDRVLDFRSCMIQEPPENFRYYDPKDKKWHIYMPDYYLPDYNLIVEIKDGGDQTNTNPAFIETTKYKVQLKDEVMRKQTKYNYIKICGTNYGPFLETLYQIVHEQSPDTKKRKAIITITESASVESGEDIDWNDQPNDVNSNEIRLMIGYLPGTNLPAYTAITDSYLKVIWYVSDYESQILRFARYDDQIFKDGGYRIYKYIGDQETMSNVFKLIVSQAEGNEIYHMWDIIDILGASNIFFDDGISLRNNTQRRSDFILIEQYFCTAGEGDDCE